VRLPKNNNAIDAKKFEFDEDKRYKLRNAYGLDNAFVVGAVIYTTWCVNIGFKFSLNRIFPFWTMHVVNTNRYSTAAIAAFKTAVPL